MRKFPDTIATKRDVENMSEYQLNKYPAGGQWDRRSYKEEYYPIDMLNRNPYTHSPPERALVAIAQEMKS